MSLTVNAKTYTADSFEKNQVSYNGANKTVSVKDDMKLSRLAPKPTTSFSGLSRTEAKLTRTLALTSALTPTGDGSVTVSIAVPVGYASADVDALLNDIGTWLTTAAAKTFAKTPQISF
jgi:hypothetical protein